MTAEVKVDALHQQTNLYSHRYMSRNQTKPRVGAQTAQRVKPSIESKYNSPTLNKIKRLLTLSRVTEQLGQEVLDLIKLYLRSLAFYNLTALADLGPQGAAGHITHRLPINTFS
jgi:hypothetical protein